MQLLLWNDFQFRYHYVPDEYTWYYQDIFLDLYNNSTYICYRLSMRQTILYVGSRMLDYYCNSKDRNITMAVMIYPISKLILLSRYVPIEVRRLLFKDRVIAAVLVADATHGYFEGILAHMEEFY